MNINRDDATTQSTGESDVRVDWEEHALELRNRARAKSRELRTALPFPAKIRRSEAAGLRAGVARVDITPETPHYLDGYWSDRLSVRVHDPLSVKALVLDDGRTRTALVVADLIAYFYRWVDRARMAQNAVPPENVVICTTHTHSCPCILGMFGPPGAVDQTYIQEVGKRITACIEEAAGNLRPAMVGFGRGSLPVENGEIPFFARNWHNPGVVDPSVLLMRVVDAQTDAPLASVVNFGNHTDVLGEHSNEISADFLGYVYETVSEKLGGETLFFQRGLGGVEPIPQGVNDMAEAEPHMQRVSDVACAAIFDASDRIEWADSPRVSLRSVKLEVPITSGELLKMVGMGLMKLQDDSAVQVTEMALLEVGPAQFLTIPGEPHPEVIFKLEDMMTGRYNFVLGMAQDEIGYVVPGELFKPSGIQELLSTGRDNELVVLNGAQRLLGVQGYAEPSCFSGE